MNQRLNAFQLLFFSCIAFIVLTSIGMLAFPGGTMLDHNTVGYSFFNNFLSELGRWRSWHGGPQWISFFSLDSALLLQATALFLFNIHFLRATNSIELHKTAYYTALISGCAFPFFLAGIALTPCDLYLPYHMFCVRVGFGLLIPLSFSYTVLIRSHHLLPNKYGNIMMTIVLAIFLYVLLIFFGPDPHKVGYVQQTAQKIIVYSMIFSLLYLSTGCMKFLMVNNR